MYMSDRLLTKKYQIPVCPPVLICYVPPLSSGTLCGPLSRGGPNGLGAAALLLPPPLARA